jgi:hypothetical protein
MAKRTWLLTDVERGVYLDNLTVIPEQVGGAGREYKVNKRRLEGGLRDSVDLIELDNGHVRVAIIPTRGMGLWKAWHSDWEIGWQSPVRGPVHPALVPLWEPSGIGWLSGFDELLCRCGLESNGAPEFDSQGRVKYPLHGKIANVPAHKVELTIDGDTGEITLIGEVDERRLFGNHLRLRSTLKMRAGEPGFQIIDEVQNPSASPAEMELLYHINLGSPLLGSGAMVVAPVKALVPRNARAVEGLATWDAYGPPEAGFAEQVYLMELLADAQGSTRVLLKSPHGERGLSLKFNLQQLPKFTLWKCTQAIQDGYVTGLEPGVNFPNPRSYEKEQGRVIRLAGGERRTFEIGFEIHADAQSVAGTEDAIRKLQAAATPQIHSQPLSGWTADAR